MSLFSLDQAAALDAQDPLHSFRHNFVHPTIEGKKQIYFLGNSLGLQPIKTASAINEVLSQWGNYGVEGFFMGERPWMQMHNLMTPMLSKIVGAKPHEVTVMNQLTVNLHLMMASFYRPQGKRVKILCEAKAFPSDQYMFETYCEHLGLNPETTIVEVMPRTGSDLISTEDILNTISSLGDELALVLFSGINYYTGQVFDMKAITNAAQDVGALVGFDLAHAAGNIELQLHDWNVDFACWCSYKYLNSGPGAVGGVFIHERHHHHNTPRLAGWWGYDESTRFKMEKGFVPDAGAKGWQLSTPAMLLYACHLASLELFEEAGIEQLHLKRKALNNYLWEVLTTIDNNTKGLVRYLTPTDPNQRGCQVSILMLKNGRNMYDALMERGLIVDWREPDVIRLAPVPLYNSFVDIAKFGNAFYEIAQSF